MSLSEARVRLAQVGGWIEEFGAAQAPERRLIHVIDTDIVTLYSSPERMAHYCSLLRSEPSARLDLRRPPSERQTLFVEAETLLADVLGNHLVWGREQPAFTSPAHRDELLGVLTAVFVAASGQQASLEVEVQRAFRELPSLDDGTASESKAALIAGYVDDLLNRLQVEAPQLMESLRLSAGLDRSRIYSIDLFRSPDPNDRLPLGFLPAAQDAEGGDFREEILAIARDIERLMIFGGSFSASKRLRVRSDSRALAHLCWLNQQLDVGGSPLRVRFVTGAPHLHQLREDSSWAQRLPPRLRQIFELLRADLRELIHHPLCFVDDPELQQLLGLAGADSGDTGKLGVWLRDRLDKPRRASAEAIASDAESELLTHAVSELIRLLKAARARQSFAPDKAWLATLVRDILAAKRERWDTLLKDSIQRILPSFLASLATLQAPERPTQPERGIARNLPPLRFDRFVVCQSFCNELYRDHSAGGFDPEALRARLTQVIDADHTLYSPLIAIAMWRAAERDWPRARVMAKAALEVANRHIAARQQPLPDVDNGIFGEESAFLHAVAIRITAGQGRADETALDDLNAAERELTIAEDRQRDFRQSRGEASPTSDNRFAAERLSLHLTGRLLGRLARLAASEQRSEQSLFDDAWALFQSLDGLAQSYLDDYVRQQVLTTLAQVVLLDRYGVSGMEIYPIVQTTLVGVGRIRAKSRGPVVGIRRTVPEAGPHPRPRQRRASLTCAQLLGSMRLAGVRPRVWRLRFDQQRQQTCPARRVEGVFGTCATCGHDR